MIMREGNNGKIEKGNLKIAVQYGNKSGIKSRFSVFLLIFARNFNKK
jgi:hypothetical protein